MRAMLSQAPLDLRVNIIKARRDEVLGELKKDGFDAHAGKTAPYAIRVFGRPQIAQHPLFKEGYIEIQDEGSQMVAVVADAKPGEQVADFCAGAGGKTLALAANMDNKGRVVALDVLGGRLMRAKERFRRAGLHNIETRELTSERDKYVKRHQGHFDLVLVDAPCTGTGTWRRDPDKRWRQLGPGISALVPLQKSILDSASRMVKPGGRLVYATCSLLPEENERQVENFLREHHDYSLSRDFLKLTPAQNDTDGFFAAVMVKKGAEG
jgi:16S rRNA (cytosine967-C5)-methyltransferase